MSDGGDLNDEPTPRERARARLRARLRWVMLAGLLVVGLLGTEVVLRIRNRVERPRTDGDGWHTPHARLGWVARPNWEGAGQLPLPPGPAREPRFRPFPVRINRAGLRMDRDPQLVPPAGTTRVCLIGDSFTFGFGVDVRQGFAHRLDQALRPDGEALNLGTCAWGVGQMFLAVEDQALPLQPDVVVITVIEDDFRRALRRISTTGVEKPAFVLRGGVALPQNLPLPPPPPGGWQVKDLPPGGGPFLLWKLGALGSRLRAGLAGGGEAARLRFRLGEALLRQAAELITKAGAQPVLVFFPRADELEPDGESYGALLERLAPELAYLDLTPALRAEQAKGGVDEPLYLPDGHPAGRGHAAAAAALEEFLRDRGFLGPALPR